MQQLTYYHIYNRGADRRKIFHNQRDYHRFLQLVDRYLNEYAIPHRIGGFYPNFSGDIQVVTYCLMPNHFHLLIGATSSQVLGKFFRCLKIAYCHYFNDQNMRTGVLFETIYQARLLESQYDLINVSRYIHQNPTKLGADLLQYEYSSLTSYQYNNRPTWLEPSVVLDNFRDFRHYQEFVALESVT